MNEQLSFFAERDPLVIAVEGIRAHYEWHRDGREDYLPFDVWLRDNFSHYYGGTTGGEFFGYSWFDYSPKGLTLSNFRDNKQIVIPKAKILKALGIKDDHKDAMKDADE